MHERGCIKGVYLPQRLELDDRACDPVVRLDDLLRLLGRHEVLVGLEFEHRLLDAPHELPSPHDVARHGGRQSHHGRTGLLLLVEQLHRLEVEAIVVEDDEELGVEVVLERLALQYVLELLEQRERVVGRVDALEALVDEALQRCLELLQYVC